MSTFTELTVKIAAFPWLEAIAWHIAHGPGIAPDMLAPERREYGDVVPAQRFRDALARRKTALPAAALEAAFRKLTWGDAPWLLEQGCCV